MYTWLWMYDLYLWICRGASLWGYLCRKLPYSKNQRISSCMYSCPVNLPKWWISWYLIISLDTNITKATYTNTYIIFGICISIYSVLPWFRKILPPLNCVTHAGRGGWKTQNWIGILEGMVDVQYTNFRVCFNVRDPTNQVFMLATPISNRPLYCDVGGQIHQKNILFVGVQVQKIPKSNVAAQKNWWHRSCGFGPLFNLLQRTRPL